MTNQISIIDKCVSKLAESNLKHTYDRCTCSESPHYSPRVELGEKILHFFLFHLGMKGIMHYTFPDKKGC